MKVFYLSFVAEPEDVFLGVVITEARDMLDAVKKTHHLKINPGGQVLFVEVPPEEIPERRYFDRLLQKKDINEIWPDAKSIREYEEENK